MSVNGPPLPPSATTLAVSGVVGNDTLTATVSGGGAAGTVSFKDASSGNATIATASTNTQTSVYGFTGLTYQVSAGTSAIAVGDFNGDGKPDLVTVNGSDNTVSILLGNGDGTFQAQQTYAAGTRSNWVAVGDFSGDGNLDLAVSNFGDSDVSIMLGNGDGTFRAQQGYATGFSPYTVAVGDFNGDGRLDLAVSNYSDSTVSVLLGNGDGTFQAQQTCHRHRPRIRRGGWLQRGWQHGPGCE